MNVNFAFKNFEPSDHLKKYARRRMEKLGRFFGKAADLEVDVVLNVDKFRNHCEVNVSGEGLHINAHETAQDMYAAIDLITDKLESQIKRKVSRVKEQRRKARNADIDVFSFNVDAEPEENQEIAVGTDRFATKPLHIDEALMQLEDIGSEFLVFLNAENNRVNVIYRQKVSGYAIIDPIL
ncbi:MAG: ribosome-associated translation inhibitor RaiA [Desulfovibrio sp.]|nr:ribosome-associated translation inhibitor RaiA [Desulfovibrio sp.]